MRFNEQNAASERQAAFTDSRMLTDYQAKYNKEALSVEERIQASPRTGMAPSADPCFNWYVLDPNERLKQTQQKYLDRPEKEYKNYCSFPVTAYFCETGKSCNSPDEVKQAVYGPNAIVENATRSGLQDISQFVQRDRT